MIQEKGREVMTDSKRPQVSGEHDATGMFYVRWGEVFQIGDICVQLEKLDRTGRIRVVVLGEKDEELRRLESPIDASRSAR